MATQYNVLRYSPSTIRSVADAETALVWDGRQSKRLPPDIQATALRKLMMLNRSRTLSDLRVKKREIAKELSTIAVRQAAE